MAISFKGAHFPKEIILTCVRWYVAYPLSTRNLEEMVRERQVSVDHSGIRLSRDSWDMPFHCSKYPKCTE